MIDLGKEQLSLPLHWYPIGINRYRLYGCPWNSIAYIGNQRIGRPFILNGSRVYAKC